MKKFVASIMTVMILSVFCEIGVLANDINTCLNKTMEYLSQTVTNPNVGSVGGDWAVFALSRCGYENDDFYNSYYKNVKETLEQNNSEYIGDVSADNSRTIIALSSAGYDPSDIDGYNLYLPLEDFDYTVERGVNAASYALIAFNCTDYEITDENATNSKERLIEHILSKTVQRGGWSNGANIADIDMSAMAIVALAPYYESNEDVKEAIDEALNMLSNRQAQDGGFMSFGVSASESSAQMLCAMSVMGIDVNDERFVKNGNSVLDALMSFYDDGTGAFAHIRGTQINQMSTEQALYAMSAYERSINNKNALYDFSDVTKREYYTENNNNDDVYYEEIIYEETEEEIDDTQESEKEDIEELPDLEEEIKPQIDFIDISGNDFENEIKALAKSGIINGKSDNIFEPKATMTRAEYTAIITRALDLEGGENVFEDVNENDWFYKYVVSAYASGIINGVSKTEFAPQNLITRQEAALMCTRAAKLFLAAANIKEEQIRNILAQFDDYTNVSHWAREGMAFCYANGIIKDDSMQINPHEFVNRGEIAYMIYNLLRIKNI